MTKEQIADELESNLPERPVDGGSTAVRDELIQMAADELRAVTPSSGCVYFDLGRPCQRDGCEVCEGDL